MRRIAWMLALLIVPTGGCEEGAGRGEDVGWEANRFEDTLPSAATTPADTAGALTVMLTEWNVRLATDTITGGGTVRLRARNMGGYDHALAVAGPGGEWRTESIPPDGWAVLETQLEPGSYTVYCPLVNEYGDHREEGMESHLVVLPGPGSR